MNIADHILAAIGAGTLVYWFARLLIPVMEAADAEKRLARKREEKSAKCQTKC
jgi:hypothetical protein